MTATLVGFPRVGAKRELKFAQEKYWRKEITAEELEQVARGIRQHNWQVQAKQNLLPVSNDFSYYDGMLDTAVMLGVIPERYRALGLNPLDTFFAMARGYQAAGVELEALPMKKWFNTNYHYMVPEITSDNFTANSAKPVSQFLEAKALGIETRPVIIGPYTFLKLSDVSADLAPGQLVANLAAAYAKVLGDLAAAGATWVQIDEPALVQDMTADDLQLFQDLYARLPLTDLHQRGLNVLIQTYFGDVRDVYQTLISLPVQGIGLDFVAGGAVNSRLVAEQGFPDDKVLVAGVVNGKNIWRNDIAKSERILGSLQSTGVKNLWVGGSCSFLHVPVTIANETKTDVSNFAFAVEKLAELHVLDEFLSNSANGATSAAAASAVGLGQVGAGAGAGAVDYHGDAYYRSVRADERRALQLNHLDLPPLPTSTIGSFPQTQEVRANRAAFKKGTISHDEYTANLKRLTEEVIRQQEEIGLDVPVHGEFERNDMVEFFGENLNGFVFTENGWVQSYGSRCVKPPIIVGDVSRRHELIVEWWKFAQSLTDKPMKAILTGPTTIYNWSFSREDLSDEEVTFQIADALREEISELEEAGAKIIQIDEAALRERLPLRQSDWEKYLDWVIAAYRQTHSQLKPETMVQTHMCYSQFEDIIDAIRDMDADVLLIENSRAGDKFVELLTHIPTALGAGVYDIHSPNVPSPAALEENIQKLTEQLPVEKIWVNPDCGLKTRNPKETWDSLINMVNATKSVRESLSA